MQSINQEQVKDGKQEIVDFEGSEVAKEENQEEIKEEEVQEVEDIKQSNSNIQYALEKSNPKLQEALLSLLEQRKISIAKRLLLSQLLIGMSRDFVWGTVTFNSQDYFEGELGSFFGPTITQMTFTLFCMLATVIQLDKMISKKLNTITPASLIQHCALVLPSWTAIPVWNGAQLLGKWVGQNLAMSETAAGYFAGIFTGVAETIWQNGIMLPLLLRQRIQVLELVLTAFSGAVWQWVLQYNVSANTSSEIFVGANIAIAVALTTLSMTLLAWTINIIVKIQKEPGETNEKTALLSGDSMKKTYENYGFIPQTSQRQQPIVINQQPIMDAQTPEFGFT